MESRFLARSLSVSWPSWRRLTEANWGRYTGQHWGRCPPQAGAHPWPGTAVAPDRTHQ